MDASLSLKLRRGVGDFGILLRAVSAGGHVTKLHLV